MYDNVVHLAKKTRSEVTTKRELYRLTRKEAQEVMSHSEAFPQMLRQQWKEHHINIVFSVFITTMYYRYKYTDASIYYHFISAPFHFVQLLPII